MESLWRYIDSLSLSKRNREWLAGKLLEDSQGMLEEEVLEKIDSGLKDVKAGSTMSARELLEELRHEL